MSELYPHGSPPQAPRPSEDLGVKHLFPDLSSDSGTIPLADNLNLSTLTPFAALKLLSNSVGSVIHEEQRPLPTPPISSPNTPKSMAFQRDGANDERSLDGASELPFGPGHHHSLDIPTHHKTPIGSPEVHPHDPAGALPPSRLLINETNANHERQCLAIARVFHCKTPPPISLQEYLQRIHQYCYMSTGVYLAAACYIQRLTGKLWKSSSGSGDDEEATYVQITPRSVHRLVLAALRVAHLLIEDNTWPHERFAGVGGVPPKNLTRLEIALCFLLDFKLWVCSENELYQAAKWMIEGVPSQRLGNASTR